MTKHPNPKHLLVSIIGFSAGYLIGLFLERFGWHAYLAGAIGTIIAHYSIHYLAP